MVLDYLQQIRDHHMHYTSLVMYLGVHLSQCKKSTPRRL
jgi:hypothetical protein